MKTLLHIPHSSYTIPSEYKKLFYLDERELLQEQIKMTDSYTDDLFDVTGIDKLIFPISRLICDVERFRDKSEETMTKQGMWVCYTKTSYLKKLKLVDLKHEQTILEKYYDKHHSEFYRMVTKNLTTHKQCLIIDCHSFPSSPLPYELNQDKERPDICIGTDDFHTPSKIRDYVCKKFTKLGYKVALNTPFSGTIVPIEYYGNNKNVYSLMIEINRGLYMNQSTGEKSLHFQILKEHINDIITSLTNLTL